MSLEKQSWIVPKLSWNVALNPFADCQVIPTGLTSGPGGKHKLATGFALDIPRRGTGVPPVEATAKMAVPQREQNSRCPAHNGLKMKGTKLPNSTRSPIQRRVKE
jgi:hypothetical protein